MARLRIGLIGWGTVGSALGRLVAAGPLPLDLACLAVRNPAAARGVPLPDGVAVVTPDDVAAASLDVVVELAGGTEEPLGWARTALAAGTAYVTANKALLANHGDELSTLARQNHAALLASASVGGGVPMLETRVTRDPDDPWKIDVRSVGIGPLAYQERIRRTLVKFADPDGKIALPKGSRSAGW